jgi:hypothetical protein
MPNKPVTDVSDESTTSILRYKQNALQPPKMGGKLLLYYNALRLRSLYSCEVTAIQVSSRTFYVGCYRNLVFMFNLIAVIVILS